MGPLSTISSGPRPWGHQTSAGSVRLGKGPCLFCFSCGRLRPLRNGPRFSLFFSEERKHSVKPRHLPRAPAALPTASRLCQMGTETCSWVRAGSTESKSLRSGTRKRGMEQERMGAVPAGHGAGCFCLCTATSQSSWHLLGPGDICHPPWGLTCKCPSPQKAKTPSQAATRCARPG